MSTTHIELGPPTELVRISDLEEDIEKLSDSLKYSVSLDESAANLVQQRCTAAATRCEAPRSDLAEAVHAWWMEHTTGSSMPLSHGKIEDSDRLFNMVPPSFRLDRFVKS